LLGQPGFRADVHPSFESIKASSSTLPQAQLEGRLFAVQQNEGGGALGYSSDLAEVRKLTEAAPLAQIENAGS
jgi:hypothetical protein